MFYDEMFGLEKDLTICAFFSLILGGIGIVWYIVWLLIIYNTPDTHPWISLREQAYIQDNIVKEEFHKEVC